MVDILDEVREDLQKERYKKLMKRYGGPLLLFIIVLVGSTAALTMYQNYQRNRQAESGMQYAAALDKQQSGATETAREQYAELSQNATYGYRELATLRLAALQAESSPEESLKTLDNLVADSKANAAFRDLAALRAAALIANREDVLAEQQESLQPRLEKLADGHSVWSLQAQEWLVVTALEKGNTELGRAMLLELTSRPAAGPEQQQRFQAYLSQIPSPPSQEKAETPQTDTMERSDEE